MSAHYASAVILAVLSFVVTLLVIAPLCWHIKNRNISASCLVSWVLVSNFVYFVNILLWPNDDFHGRFDGVGLCDITAKLEVGRSTALPAATLCILKGLADVMDTSKVNLAPSKAQRLRKRAIDLSVCIGLPVMSMLLHLIVQPDRYLIFGASGCAASFAQTWLTVVLLDIMPILLTLGGAYYCCIIIIRLHKYRSAFTGMLEASGTSKSRFLRLLILAIIFIFLLLPTEIVVLKSNLPDVYYGFSWSEIHRAAAWHHVTFIVSHGDVVYDRWISVGCGFLVFFALGSGQEARSTYRSWMLKMGLGRIFPSLRMSVVQQNNGQSQLSSAARLLGLRAKHLIIPLRWSRRAQEDSFSDITLSSPTEDIKMYTKQSDQGIITKDISFFTAEERLDTNHG